MKKSIFTLLMAVTFVAFTATAQTATPKTSKQEKAATSSMTVKCTKGGCCGGGMLCCGEKASTLQKSLEGVSGVSKVEVNKGNAEATIAYTGEVKLSDLNKAIEKGGL